MTQSEARSYLSWYFRTQWGSKTPLVLDNEEFKPPATSWVRFSIAHVSSDQETLGAPPHRMFRRNALLQVQVFSKPGLGTKTADDLAEDVRQVFEGKTLNTIRFHALSTYEMPVKGWYSIMVEGPFQYEQEK